MLGFGGHFATKSRRYSTTHKTPARRRREWQRTTRTDWRHRHHDADDSWSTTDDDTTLIVCDLTLAGIGWNTTADAQLAAAAAARAREHRALAREERTTATDHRYSTDEGAHRMNQDRLYRIPEAMTSSVAGGQRRLPAAALRAASARSTSAAPDSSRPPRSPTTSRCSRAGGGRRRPDRASVMTTAEPAERAACTGTSPGNAGSPPPPSASTAAASAITRKASGTHQDRRQGQAPRDPARPRRRRSPPRGTAYTVDDAVRDWLAYGLAGRAANTVENYTHHRRAPHHRPARPPAGCGTCPPRTSTAGSLRRPRRSAPEPCA